jgi:uncharacterized oxidoreductase
MEISGRTVLITGGGSGIGRALAARFLRAGSDVIICGRREEKLREAQAAHPTLAIRTCDVESETARIALIGDVIREFPRFDVLVNNAGIQQYFQLTEPDLLDTVRREVTINLEAPLHLAMLCLPHFMQLPRAAILNVTSGLAFVPMTRAPLYSATKAALHSLTLSLRYQLSGSTVEVVEIIPPAVDTDLGGPGLHTFGIPVDTFADVVFDGLARGEQEITHSFSHQTSHGTREERDALFQRINPPKT